MTEEQLAARKASLQRYGKSAKGKAAAKRYKASAKGKAMAAAHLAENRERDRKRYALNINGRRDKTLAYGHARPKKPRKRLTPEELAAAQRLWAKRYKSSSKGKATAAAYRKAYALTPEGKAWAARAKKAWHSRTPAQIAARASYEARWLASPAGKASLAATRLRRRAIGKVGAEVVRELQRTTVCYYCGVGIEVMSGRKWHPCRLTIDHMIPVARGGTNDRSNLAAACADCNSAKGAMTAAEYLGGGLAECRRFAGLASSARLG